MSVVLTWLRLELRRRWRSLLVLVVLIALATGTVLTAVAGARRGASAIDRLLEVTLPATAAVRPTSLVLTGTPSERYPRWRRSARSRCPGTTSTAFRRRTRQGPFAFDAQVMHTFERLVVLEGWLADPTRADEAVVSPAFVDRYGLDVGDTVTARLGTPEALDVGFSSGAPWLRVDGPAIPPGSSGWFVRSGSPTRLGAKARWPPPPIRFARYWANLIGHKEVVPINALVRLCGGADALPAFRADLAWVSGRGDIELWDLFENARAAPR
jgi:hypothetical protein